MAKTLEDLIRIDTLLTKREREILTALRNAKVMFTSQIKTLFFNNSKTDNSAIRATNREMQSLHARGLVDTLDKRISGRRIGTASYIWHLTEQGYRLLDIGSSSPAKRTRFVEPSYLTLKHKLAVAECYVQIVGISRRHKGMEINQVEFEPDSWRDYHETNRFVKLKPDMTLVTRRSDYEYRYFIEMDLATESSAEIIRKCDRYHAYLATGKEQDIFGVFPLVIWVVPDDKRKTQLEEVVRKEYQSRYHIFLIITPDELEKTITTDPNEELLI